MKTLQQVLTKYSNNMKPLSTTEVAIEDALANRIQVGENHVTVSASMVAAELLSGNETVNVLAGPEVGIAFLGENQAVGDALVTAIAAEMVMNEAEPSVFETSTADLEQLPQMALQDGPAILVTIGGDTEQLMAVIKESGHRVFFGTVAAKPLENVAGAAVGETVILMLPEDAGECLAAIELVLLPVLANARADQAPELIRAELITPDPLTFSADVVEYIPAKFSLKRGVGQVRPVREADLLTAMQQANGWLVIDPEVNELDSQSIVDFLPKVRI